MNMKKYISCLFILGLVLGTNLHGQNLALNKPVYVSSVENTGYPGANVVDGNVSTRWSSQFGDPQWIYVDLGSTYNVGAVTLRWETASGKAYQIQVSSDATTWNTVYTTATGSGGVQQLTFAATPARYVRMYGTARNGSWGYSLWEFEVYGPGDGQAPTVPASVTVGSITTTGMNLSWTASTDNVGVTGYNVYVNNVLNTTVTTPTATLSGLTAGTTYALTIKAKDAAGNVSAASTALSVTTQTTSGTNVALFKTASGGSGNYPIDGNINTFWSSGWSDPQSLIIDLGSIYSINKVILRWQSYGKTYQIQVSNNATTWTTVYSTTTGAGGVEQISFAATPARYVKMYGTERGTAYGYGISEFEVYDVAVTTSAPSVPAGLIATAASSTQINLSWTDATSENGYLVERKASTESSFTQIASLGANVTSYSSSGLTAGTQYQYRIRTYNGTANSGYSTVAQATTTTYVSQATQPQYNGNISAVQWKVNSPSTDAQATDVKEYDYYYDAMNRITNSQYQNKTQATYNGSYDEGSYSYDANGNLKTLKRYGYTTSGTKELVDDLTYTYMNSNTSNQLQTIVDAGDKNFGYIDNNKATAYTYDANGNMTTDLNKGITVTYNLLNLPSRVANGSDYIDYLYDATGAKLQKKVYKAGILTTTIDYNGELEFYNSALKYVHTEEGLAEYNSTNSSFTYEYFLKDHLGNTRAVVSADGNGNLVVGQTTDYYPFGMAFTGTTTLSQSGSGNKYQYNGKEKQDEGFDTNGDGKIDAYLDWYDYGARFYDPQIGRFTTIDPLAGKKPWLSSYIYCSNNPINRIDPDGKDDYTVDKDGHVTFKKKTNSDNDRLIALGAKGKIDRGFLGLGKIKNNMISVNKGVFQSKETKSATYDGQALSFDKFTTTGKENGQALFEFVAKNTNVEWGLTKVGDNSITGYLTTTHDPLKEVGGTELLKDPLIRASAYQGDDHSHPQGPWQPSSASLPLGDPGRRQGDIGSAAMIEKMYPNSHPVFRVYNVPDGTYCTYNSQTVIMQELPDVIILGTKK